MARPRRSVRRASRPPLWPWYVGLVAIGIFAIFVTVRLLAVPAEPPPDGPRDPFPTTAAARLSGRTLATPSAALGETATPAATPTLARTPRPMPTPIQAPRSSRYSPIPFTPDAQLADSVLQRLVGRSGRFGIAIKELDSGRGVLIDPDGEYEAASLFKLSVMFEVFKQRELGALAFDEVLVFTDRHVAYDLGTLDRGAGSTILLEEALERMIVISDNSSAILLTDRVGALNINRDMQGLGLQHTRLALDDLRTSPHDMLVFFEMLARGEGVSPVASAEMVQLLARQRINDRIPRLLPPGTVSAHKTGNLPGVVNDVGIVYGPDVTFLIAVLVEGTTEEAEVARVTAEIAALGYEHFRTTRASDPSVQLPTVGPTALSAPATPQPPTAEPTPTATANPEPTAEPTPTRAPAPTIGPSATPLAAASSTPLPRTATPTLTSTPLPSATPTPPGPRPA